MKKRLISLALSLCLLLAVLPAATAFAAGTPDTGWYTADPNADVFNIGTADELAGLALLMKNNAALVFTGKTINITADIDLSAYAGTWEQIAASATAARQFQGTLDGGGHEVSNLSGALALFGYVGANGTIKNLALTNVAINGGTSNSSAIVRQNSGRIENCAVTGTINGGGPVGAIAGTNVYSGIITNCVAMATVAGTAIPAASVAATAAPGASGTALRSTTRLLPQIQG